jgi:D-serine deaminase-like pyridoxal phosphate-dependent protein
MKLSQLDTPCLILDRGILSHNAEVLSRHIKSLGVNLRPHMKTAKSIDVAGIVLEGTSGGITVSTLKEAEYFAAHGITDIIYAVSMVASKVERASAMLRKGTDLKFIMHNVDAAHSVAARAVALGVELTVLIELDVGDARGGMLPDADALLEMGRVLHETPGVRLGGVLCHAGNSYGCRTIEDLQTVTDNERDGALLAAGRLREAGLPCDIVSIGSTPTAVHARDLSGITEIRSGVYMFGDVFQSEIYSCKPEDMAMSVLATVIGHRTELNCALIDAGSLALSQDRSTGAAGLPEDVGYGLVMDETATKRVANMRVSRAFQEHGVLSCEGEFPFEQFPIGTRVRVFPNHACTMAAMYEAYQVIDGSDAVVDCWTRVNGW